MSSIPFSKLINMLNLCLLFGIAGLFFFIPVETGDVWWHLKSGQYIYQTQLVPGNDPFPFAQEKTPWILTQWLGSLIYFLIYQSNGLLGLKIARAVILTSAIAVFIRYAWKRIPQALAIILGLILMLAIDNRPHLRPFVFNFIFIQIFLAALMQFGRNPKFKTLLPIPLAGLIWVNIHLGSFIYGISLLGIFTFCALMQCLTQSKNLSTSDMKKRLVGYLTITAVFICTFLFNPYGLDGALHALRTLFIEDYIQFKNLARTINELQPPIDILSMTYIWTLPALAIGILGVVQDKTNRFRNIILLIFGLFMFTYGRRANVFFALISLYIFTDSFQIKSQSNNTSLGKFIPTLTLILCLFFVGAGVKKMTRIYFQDDRVYRYGNMLENQDSPRAILALLNNYKFSGRIFNDDIYGGYLLWKNYPSLRPFNDTRQINLKANQIYNAVLHDPEKYWPEVEKNIKFKAILLDANKFASRKALLYFLKDKNWELAKVNADAVLFLKREYTHGLYLNALRKQNTHIPNYKQKLNQILNDGPKDHYNYVYVERIATAITLFELGFQGAALQQLLETFKATNTPYQHEMTKLLLNQFSR